MKSAAESMSTLFMLICILFTNQHRFNQEAKGEKAPMGWVNYVLGYLMQQTNIGFVTLYIQTKMKLMRNY